MSHTPNYLLFLLFNFAVTNRKINMDILKLSTEWASAEVFSAKMVALVSLLFFVVAIGFSQFAKTPMANSFVWPLAIAGLLLVAVSGGLYYANKPRITQFEKAYQENTDKFIESEIARTAKSQKELSLVLKVLPAIIIVGALLVIFLQAPLGRAIGYTIIALMTVLLFVDSNTDARNTAYHKQLIILKP